MVCLPNSPILHYDNGITITISSILHIMVCTPLKLLSYYYSYIFFFFINFFLFLLLCWMEACTPEAGCPALSTWSGAPLIATVLYLHRQTQEKKKEKLPFTSWPHTTRSQMPRGRYSKRWTLTTARPCLPAT